MRFDRTYVEKIESELAELRHENQQLHWQLANRCANCESGKECSDNTQNGGNKGGSK